MPLPPKLEAELQYLRQTYELEIVEEPAMVNVMLKSFPLGDGFNVQNSDLLIRVPRTYPDANPDMFWVDKGVVLSDGRVPQAAELIEVHLGRPWRRFSWHRRPWNPNVDNMHGYIEFVRRRLREKR